MVICLNAQIPFLAQTLVFRQKLPYQSRIFQPLPIILNRLQNGFVGWFPFLFPPLFLFKGSRISFLEPHFKPCQVPLGERVVLIQSDAVKNRFGVYQFLNI